MNLIQSIEPKTHKFSNSDHNGSIMTDNKTLGLFIYDTLREQHKKIYVKYEITGIVEKERKDYDFFIKSYNLRIMHPTDGGAFKLDYNYNGDYKIKYIKKIDITSHLEIIQDRLWSLNQSVYQQNVNGESIKRNIGEILDVIRKLADIIERDKLVEIKLFNDIWS